MKRMVLVATLAAAMVLSAAAFANADVATYTGAGVPRTASGNVTVTAAVNPKITLTVDTPEAGQSVDFGAVDPGVSASKAVNLSVDSNKQFDLVAAQDTTLFGGITLNRTLGTGESNIAKGANVARIDTYSLDVPWTTDPNPYTATVTYTVTQD